jgi:hypothetical protein
LNAEEWIFVSRLLADEPELDVAVALAMRPNKLL